MRAKSAIYEASRVPILKSQILPQRSRHRFGFLRRPDVVRVSTAPFNACAGELGMARTLVPTTFVPHVWMKTYQR